MTGSATPPAGATAARLVQSSRFPNVWSIIAVENSEDAHTWRDPLVANGAISAESAVLWAWEHEYTIVQIDADASEVIAGIEYRAKRPILGKFEHVDRGGKLWHVIEVYSNGVACVLSQEHGWTDEMPMSELVKTEEVQ